MTQQGTDVKIQPVETVILHLKKTRLQFLYQLLYQALYAILL